MPRFLPAAIAIATLALPGARAAADDCMCLGPDTLFLESGALEDEAAFGGEWLDAEWLDGESFDGEVLESPDDTIETVDPSVPSPTLAEAPRPSRGPVAWCRSADDPRCQRDDNGRAPYRISLGHVPVATLLTTPPIPSPGVGRIRFPQTVEHGPAGFAFRLDRPPRV